MIHIDINRINLALHGVSAQVAEAAVVGLDKELAQRLGILASVNLASIDIGQLAIGPLHNETVLDAAALRGLIAERLSTVIRARLEMSAQTTKGGG